MVDYALSIQDQTTSQNFRVWKASLQCLYWIKSKYAVQGSRRREREAGREVEEYRAEKFKTTSALIDWLENNPESTGNMAALPIFTGTTTARKEALECDTRFLPAKVKVGWFNEDINLDGDEYPDD